MNVWDHFCSSQHASIFHFTMCTNIRRCRLGSFNLNNFKGFFWWSGGRVDINSGQRIRTLVPILYRWKNFCLYAPLDYSSLIMKNYFYRSKIYGLIWFVAPSYFSSALMHRLGVLISLGSGKIHSKSNRYPSKPFFDNNLTVCSMEQIRMFYVRRIL